MISTYKVHVCQQHYSPNMLIDMHQELYDYELAHWFTCGEVELEQNKAAPLLNYLDFGFSLRGHFANHFLVYIQMLHTFS